ncbi:MAG: ATP-binding protein [Betaproteobacteria bacterium]|nr:ATP-binding protein [Betaproteobacteria bacterium]
MLIEFSVSNYRSFREKQTLSMVAAPRLKKGKNVFTLDVRGESVPNLLKVAAIYGPNASGKSNFIQALRTISYFVDLTPSAQPKRLPVAPFRFDPQLAKQPSRFELHFVHARQRYEFLLEATSERIIVERLTGYPSGKETLLYERRHTPEGENYIFGDRLEGGHDLHETWRKLTGPQMLFVAQAVANCSEDLMQLRTPLEWLRRGLYVVSDDMRSWADASQELAKKVPRFAADISSFLQDVDVPVTNIRFDPLENLNTYNAPKGIIQSQLTDTTDPKDSGEAQKSKTTLTHTSALGEADFDFSEESGGTKNLIGFWLPWSLLGEPRHMFRTLIVDEFDSSLHPRIVASLVAKHLDSDVPAQLIFTTHDTHLMDTKLLRRDQFWITERDVNGATQLRSIHDFQGRESEDLEKRYFEGRYRGLPFTRKG